MNIALFGTSADPPTSGHQVILGWLMHHFDYVAVWAADNPFKSHAIPLSHRTAMLGLLIDELRQYSPDADRLRLHPELSHPRTLVTVEMARQKWPNAVFTLVIGADLVPQLSKWYHFEELLRQIQFMIVPRSGYVLKEQDLEHLRQMGATLAIADVNVPNVSSTAYRERGDGHAITPPIEAYIHKEHLYANAWHPDVTPANMTLP